MVFGQILSLVGAAFILWGFMGLNSGWFIAESKKYHWINLAGALMLVTSAGMDKNLGFIILNAVWCVISTRKLLSGKLV